MTDRIPEESSEEERLRFARESGQRRLVTVIGVCLDESGSMGQRDVEGADKCEAAIHAFNEYLRGQQAVTADDCLLGLVKFNTHARVAYGPTPVAAVPPLSRETYYPNGGTALFDAVAYAVADMEKTPADRYVCVVITDGEENASKETSLEQLRWLIQTKEARGNWTFVYLSADAEAFTVAHQYGFLTGNVANYAPSASGTAVGVASLNAATVGYRVSRSMTSSNFYATPPPDPDAQP